MGITNFHGGGHDWNGNGKSDSFDRYVDYKASSSMTNNGVSKHESKESFTERNEDSQGSGTTILKSLLTIGLCFAGFALPITTDMGSLGTAICLLSAVVIGAMLWRK